MAVTHGMDPAAVESLGHRLQDDYAARIDAIANELNSLVSRTSSQWTGPKGDLFRSWWPAKRSKLIAISQDLHGFGQSALNNASEQRDSSRQGNTPASAAASAGQFWNHFGMIAGLTGWASRGDDLVNIVKRYKLLASARGWAKAGPDVGWLGLVNTGIDITYLMRAINNASVDGSIRAGIDIGFDVGGMVYFPIGLGKTAWDVGWWTGSQIEDSLNTAFGTRDAAYDSILYSRYGTTNLTTDQAHEMAHRYDGVGGYLRWGGDTVTSWFKGW